MEKIVLEQLLKTEQVEKNPELKQDLSVILENSKYSSLIYYYHFTSNISISTYQYLIESNYLRPKYLFDIAANSQLVENQDQLLDLALANKVDFDSMYSLPSSLTIQNLDKCLENGLSLNRAANLVFNENNEAKKEFQLNLIKHLVSKGANLAEVYNVQSYFSVDDYKLLLDSGLKASVMLNKALSFEPGERRDQLLDLALANKVNFDSMYYLPSSLTIQILDKCLENGLSLNRAVNLVFNENNEAKKESQLNLIKHLVSKGANLAKVYNVQSYFSVDDYKLLLDSGLKASVMLNKALSFEPRERRDQLLDLALANKVDFDSMYSLPSALTIQILDKCLENGLSPNKLVDVSTFFRTNF